MYRIGMFSKIGRVTIKTLRYYDEVGLLKPFQIDEENAYRYYTTAQLFRLNEIVALRQLGFSIPEVLDIIDGRNVFMLLQQRKAELIDERETAANCLLRLENYILEKKEGHCMDYQAVIKEIPAITVFSVRQIISNYAALAEFIPAAGEKLAKTNPDIQYVKPYYCFNIYHDGEHKDTNPDVEICQAVTSKGKDGDGIVFKDLPAETVASILHRGAYENLGKAYAYALQWVEQNGYKITYNIRESYIDGIWNKEQVKEWLTELQIPIEKN